MVQYFNIEVIISIVHPNWILHRMEPTKLFSTTHNSTNVLTIQTNKRASTFYETVGNNSQITLKLFPIVLIVRMVTLDNGVQSYSQTDKMVMDGMPLVISLLNLWLNNNNTITVLMATVIPVMSCQCYFTFTVSCTISLSFLAELQKANLSNVQNKPN